MTKTHVAVLPILDRGRTEALFLSHLQPSTPPTRPDADIAIRVAVRSYGGARGCAAAVAAEYGDHPEAAAARMRWALDTVQRLYATGHHAPHAPLSLHRQFAEVTA